METKPRRKGAMRIADIPPDVLRALNEGREETITLVEWLAIDMPTPLRSILPSVGLPEAGNELGRVADGLAGEGVTVRLKSIATALFEATQRHPGRAEVFEAMASHASDMVRAWAAFMLTADKTLPLDQRLVATRRFAADRSVAVRECAWDSFRPYVAADLDQGFRLLEGWVRDPDPNIRRCAVEGTRPRGVWTSHIEALKEDPEPGLVLPHKTWPMTWSRPSRPGQVARPSRSLETTRMESTVSTCCGHRRRMPMPLRRSSAPGCSRAWPGMSKAHRPSACFK